MHFRRVTTALRLLPMVCFLALAQPVGALGPGDPAPDFTRVDVDGVPFTLSDFRGQVVLLALIGSG